MNDGYIDDSNDSIYPACVFNDWGVSKTFLIIFKNEEIQLDDQFNFKLSVIVDAQTVGERINRVFPQISYLDYRMFQSIGHAIVSGIIFSRKRLFVSLKSLHDRRNLNGEI